MKNINYVVNGVLAIAVIILFVMQFSGKNETKAVKSISSGEASNGTMPCLLYTSDAADEPRHV